MTLAQYLQKDGSSKARIGTVELTENDVEFLGTPLGRNNLVAFIPVRVKTFDYTYVLFSDCHILYIDSKKRPSCFSYPEYKTLFEQCRK